MLDLVILLLASYGLSKLVVEYDGYRDIFMNLRNKYPDSALQCVICTACWITPVFFGIYMLGLLIILVPIAIIGGIILLESMVE